jgi:predicted NACHT family NTPase
MIEHRNIGHNWQFSKEQRELLRQYYDANKLLVDCLNSSCNVTPAVRSQIEETLLLPTDWRCCQMQKADYLLRLMKQRTDALVASDEKLQQFLMWVNEKSLSVEVPYKPAAVRAFYFAVAVGRDIGLPFDHDRNRDIALVFPALC